jgi:hypothetical protein
MEAHALIGGINMGMEIEKLGFVGGDLQDSWGRVSSAWSDSSLVACEVHLSQVQQGKMQIA